MRPVVPVQIQKITLAALASAVVALAALNWHIVMSPSDAAPVILEAMPSPPKTPAPVSLVQSPALMTPQPKDHRAILDRPLFDPSRRPPPLAVAKLAPTPKPVAAKFPADKFRLVGIMRSVGHPPQAMVRVSANDPGLWVAEGGLVGGWRLAEVGEDKVAFSADGETGTLKLVPVQGTPDQPSKAAPAPNQAVATAPPAPAPAHVPGPSATAKK